MKVICLQYYKMWNLSSVHNSQIDTFINKLLYYQKLTYFVMRVNNFA